jgi:hypothetical protein
MRHHGGVEVRKTSGQAYRDGKLVATEIVLTERARLESTPVPIAGTNRVDFKQTPIRGQSTIRFIQVDDPELEDELEQLIAAAGDVDLRRRQRDERWSSKTEPRSASSMGMRGQRLLLPSRGPRPPSFYPVRGPRGSLCFCQA